MFTACDLINQVNPFTLLDRSGHIGLKGDVRRSTLVMLLNRGENKIAYHACIHFGQQTTVDEFSIAQAFLHDTVTVMKRRKAPMHIIFRTTSRPLAKCTTLLGKSFWTIRMYLLSNTSVVIIQKIPTANLNES